MLFVKKILPPAGLILLSVLLLSGLFVSGCATRPSEKIHTVVFYPPPPVKPRLQFLTSIASEGDLKEAKSGLKGFLLGPDPGNNDMGRPYGVCAAPGKIYIIDRRTNKIIIVDLARKTMGYLNDTGRGALIVPSGIWVTARGIKYIADLKRRQIVVFDRNNDFVTAFGNADVFDKPVDVAVYNDRIYVCDMAKNQIIVLDQETGKQVATMGKIGGKDGEFYKPTHVTVDHAGNIYVNDTFNFRVQKFNPAGKFMLKVGQAGDALGSLTRPKGIAADREGNLYVADAAFENVQLFDKEGKLLLFMGGPGIGPGNMYLPAGIAIDYDNVPYFQKYADKEFQIKYLLYVCNMSGPNPLNVYGFGDWLGD